jgi:hypothetical protein
MEVDVVSARVGAAVQLTLRRLATVAGAIAVAAGLVGLATFATGWWVFHGSRTAWAVIGGVLCLIPVLAALAAWGTVHAAAGMAPRLITDIASFVRTPSPAAQTLIDYDSGQTITSSARTFGSMKTDLAARKSDLPALYFCVKSITLVPMLIGVALLGILIGGALGTVLLFAGLVS